VLVPQADTQSITTLVMYPVGSRYEPQKLRGVSHYIEHIMFKGTQKRKSTFVLTREIDRLGAQYNAFTGKEYTGYYIKVGKDYAKTAVDILSDMLFHSLFDPKEMEREKGPIVEELKMYRDNPLMNIDNIFEELLFDGSPLGRDIGGTDTHVMSYQRADVLAYKKKYYDPSNMTVVMAGAVDEKTEELILAHFGAEPSKEKVSRSYKPSCFGSPAREDRLTVQHKSTDQAQMMIGYPGLSYADEEYLPAADVMNTILGGSMSSRLFIQIRERRGLAYTVRSGSDHFRDTGYVYVRAAVDPKNINKTISVIQSEIKKMVEKSVTARELSDAKTHIRGALTLDMEDSSSQANWFAKEALFYPRIATPDQYLERVDGVTQAEVQKIAKRLFKPSEMRIAIIGNVKKQDVFF